MCVRLRRVWSCLEKIFFAYVDSREEAGAVVGRRVFGVAGVVSLFEGLVFVFEFFIR